MRPPDVIEAERRMHAAEIDHLIRRADSLTAQVAERRVRLRARLRSLYKLSQGGYLRLVLGAETPAELFARRDAGQRILGSDLGELAAVRAELDEIAGLREQLRERQLALTRIAVEAREHQLSGPVTPGALVAPAAGAVVGAFGAYRDPETRLELSRDGVEIACAPGEPVRAPAAGEVRHVGEMPGLGVAIVLDLGQGWAALLGRLAGPAVRVGERVDAGQVVAACAADRVALEIEQDGVWVDPAPYLPPARPAPARPARPAR